MRLRYVNQWDRDRSPKWFEILYTWFQGHGGESRIVEWRGKRYALGAGTSDRLTFYRDLDQPEVLYVLTENTSLGYLGVDRLGEGCPVYPYKAYQTEGRTSGGRLITTDEEDGIEYLEPEGFFTQQPEDVKSEGTPLDEMSGFNIVRYLLDYLPRR